VRKNLNTIANQYTGEPLVGAQVTVQNYPSLTPATVYATDALTYPVTQPMTVAADGSFPFYAPDGHYRYTINPVGGAPYYVTDDLFEDLQDPPFDRGGTVQAALDGLTGLTNIAALKALPVPTFSGTYIVQGYTTAGDGGQGIFFWNATDATADNGGTVLACTANGASNGRFNKLF
jgi:hypothetical protein